MPRVFRKQDFISIKKMQDRGLSVKKAIKKSQWSDRTVRRVYKSKTWAVYRGRIYRDTARLRIARLKAAEALRGTRDSDLLSPNDIQALTPAEKRAFHTEKSVPISTTIMFVVMAFFLGVFISLWPLSRWN